MVVAVRSRACLRKFELRVAGVSGELRTQGFVEQFRALHQIAATVAGDEMRVAAESLIAREFIIEIRRERRLQLTTSKCGVLELILGGSHGVSRTFRKFVASLPQVCRKFSQRSASGISKAVDIEFTGARIGGGVIASEFAQQRQAGAIESTHHCADGNS